MARNDRDPKCHGKRGRATFVTFGVKKEGFGKTPTLATVGLNGFGSFTGFETSRFLWVLVSGETFRRLSPGTAALSGIHSPSRIASHSWNLGRFSFMEVFTAAGSKKSHRLPRQRQTMALLKLRRGSIVEGVIQLPVCHVVSGLGLQQRIAVIPAMPAD